MKPLFSFGPFTIHFFGLMIAIGAIAGILLFIREAKRRNMNHKLLLDGVMYSLFGGILGARIFFILFYNPSFYFANPMEVFFIQNGGLSIHGGIIGGVLVGYLFLKKHKLPIWQTLDVVAPSLILAQGISRIGCDVFVVFFHGELKKAGSCCTQLKPMNFCWTISCSDIYGYDWKSLPIRGKSSFTI